MTKLTPREKMDNWVQTSTKGDEFVYHEGNIYADLVQAREPLKHHILQVKTAAMAYNDAGIVALVQRRVGKNRSQYIAQRREL